MSPHKTKITTHLPCSDFPCSWLKDIWFITIGGMYEAQEHWLRTEITNIYENKLKKGVKYFTKKLQRMAKQTNTSMEKSLFDIGKEVKNSKKTGRKKRIGKLIPVQVTAKSTREYEHRGRVLGVAGRRHKDQESRKQRGCN